MATIDAYDTKAGRRWRVIYRKSDGTQTSRRGSRRKRDAQEWLAEHVTIAKASGSSSTRPCISSSRRFVWGLRR